jgi:hypothetical protein
VPFILRSVRKSKWYQNPNVPWLTAGELQADALDDLRTKDNTLSVWYGLDDKSNRDQLVTALTATHQHITHFDYFLLDERHLHTVNIKIKEIPGDTPTRKSILGTVI